MPQSQDCVAVTKDMAYRREHYYKPSVDSSKSHLIKSAASLFVGRRLVAPDHLSVDHGAPHDMKSSRAFRMVLM